MSSNWTLYSVGECLEKVIDNRGKTPPLSGMANGVPLVEINALTGSAKFPNLRIIKKFVGNETYNTWFRSGHPTTGDILFSTVGSIGEVAIVNTQNICIAQNIIALRPNNRVITTDYLYYFLKTPSTQKKLKSLDISSVQPSIKVPHLLAIEILVPSISKQNAIAGTLSALDDRITLLRETNATLEAIAQALFKSWFVDFDPVRAKAEGREPEGMPAEVADLFPSEFEESELGDIPKGWKAGTLKDISAVKAGFAYKSSDFIKIGNPVVKIKNIVGDGTVSLLDSECISDDLANKTQKLALNDGDVVIAMTGATIGKTGIVVNDTHKTAYLNQRVAKFEGEINNWFIFCAFKNRFISDQISNFSSGSAQANVSSSGIESIKLTVPTSETLNQFSNITSPLFESWVFNQKQIGTLTELRDTILPRLMSGKLCIPDLEEQAA